MRDIETAYRKLAAVQDRLLIEASERSFPETCGVRGEWRMLTEVFQLSGPEAHARVRRAFDVGCYRDTSGTQREPHLPATSNALREGQISPAHVREISEVMHRLPTGVFAEDRSAAEESLSSTRNTLALKIFRRSVTGSSPTSTPTGSCPATPTVNAAAGSPSASKASTGSPRSPG